MDGIIVNEGPLPSSKSYCIGNAFAEFGIPNHIFDFLCSTCKRKKMQSYSLFALHTFTIFQYKYHDA